jgi:hypothetical protein
LQQAPGMKKLGAKAETHVSGRRALEGTEEPVEMISPGTAGHEVMAKPWSRSYQSIGLSAMDLSSTRSSPSPGAGVGGA